MLIKNKLDKSFGPVGASAGFVLFVAGLVITYFSFLGLILIIIGAFIGFTSTSTTIDFDKRKIKFSDNLFGIFEIGKWIKVEPEMKIGIKKSNIGWVSYNVNIPRDFVNKDYRVVLYDSLNQQIMEIKKNKSLDAAKQELDKLVVQLGLPCI
jgi:hypothetical protein